jgi:predicted transcriptional regulator
MQLKPQDFLVALKLVAWGEQRWTYARLAQELGISVSEAHGAVKRGLEAGLLLQNRPAVSLADAGGSDAAPSVQEPQGIYRVTRKRVRRAADAESKAVADNPVRPHSHNLAEFALHGAKYAFPGVRLPLVVGVPTSHSAPAFAGVFAPGSTDFVWPHPNGSVRGVGVEPLHPSVPFAAMQDAKLYEMLALFDALRVGKARERGMALERLQALIDPNAPKKVKGPMYG